MKKQKFNILTDDLPESWRDVKVNTGFKQVLKFFNLIENDFIEEADKAMQIIELFFPDGLPNYQDDVFEFIKTYINFNGNEDDEGGSSGDKVFDFNIDSGRLYSAFRQSYNINLIKDNLHWWEFHQLFEDLPQDTKLKEVIQIRSEKPRKDDKGYNKQLKRLQRLYAIEQEVKKGPVNYDNFFNGWGGK